MDVIVDIDGTLANGEHRQHHVANSPKDWPAYQAKAHLDKCIEPIAIVVRNLKNKGLHRIILCSGRGEQERQVTEEWLAKHQIPYDRLYMRTEKDYRPDDIIKEELLNKMLEDKFRPELVFDDRDRVVKMWRRRGLICAQVAEGNF